MPGSLTTPGRMGTRAIVLMRVAFHNCNSVSTRNQKSYAAQWLAYALPYRRFACTLAGTYARLGADVVRYSFIVVDSHHLLLAGVTGALSNWHKGDALQRCSENVRCLRSCCRVGEPAGKPLEPDII